MTKQSDASVGTTDTVSIADALREAADWLDAHPEVQASHAYVPMKAAAREDLEKLAAALGDRAREELTYDKRGVEIYGNFGGDSKWDGVRVYADVSLSKLAPQPPAPKYEPIIPPSDGDEWSVRR